MIEFIINKLLIGFLIIIASITTLYCMIHMVPGDPIKVLLGPRATLEMQEALSIKLGLNDPLFIQIINFIKNIFRGDLGADILTQRPVLTILLEQTPHTILLVVVSIFWAILLGIPIGCYNAIYQGSLSDKLSGIITISFIAIPPFVVALYSLLIFAVALKWLPAIGVGESGDLSSKISHLILPSFAVGLGWVGYLARLVRSSMLEVLKENHVRTARAYGISERNIILHYVLRIAILPTITLLGTGIGILFSSSVFAEIVFSRPGIGKLIYESVINRNYPVVMGAVLVTSTLFVITTTLSDIVNAILDPRIINK